MSYKSIEEGFFLGGNNQDEIENSLRLSFVVIIVLLLQWFLRTKIVFRTHPTFTVLWTCPFKKGLVLYFLKSESPYHRNALHQLWLILHCGSNEEVRKFYRRTDDGKHVIRIAHLIFGSGDLKTVKTFTKKWTLQIEFDLIYKSKHCI